MYSSHSVIYDTAEAEKTHYVGNIQELDKKKTVKILSLAPPGGSSMNNTATHAATLYTVEDYWENNHFIRVVMFIMLSLCAAITHYSDYL